MPGAGFRVAFRARKREMSARYPCLPLGLTRLTHDRGPHSRRRGGRHQAFFDGIAGTGWLIVADGHAALSAMP
jgi:hypothetical protein